MPQKKDSKPDTKPAKKDDAAKSHSQQSAKHQDDFGDKWKKISNPDEVKSVLDSVNVQDPDGHDVLMVAHDNSGQAYHAIYSAKQDDEKFKKIYDRGDLPEDYDA